MKTDSLLLQSSTNDPGAVVGSADRTWKVFDVSSMMTRGREASTDRAVFREKMSYFCVPFAGPLRQSRNVPRWHEIEQHSDPIIANRKVERSNLQVVLSAVTPLKTEASEWAAARTAIAGWASLREDWDDDGAAPLPAVLLDAVRSFVQAAEKRQVAEPRPYISSDGEVGFHWDGELRAAVSFLAEDRFLAYVARVDRHPVRIAGPLELATASKVMFDALATLP